MKTKRNKKDEQHDAAAEGAPEVGAGEALQEDIDRLGAALAEAEGRYKRALADYQNYQRRAMENERRAHERGGADVVERMIPLLDHFRLGLEQLDPESGSAASAIEGMRAIYTEFVRTMASFGVREIAPEPNDEFDPSCHEAMLRAEAEGIEHNRVVQSFQPGWAFGDRVIRPAKVSVSPADESAGDASSENIDDASGGGETVDGGGGAGENPTE